MTSLGQRQICCKRKFVACSIDLAFFIEKIYSEIANKKHYGLAKIPFEICNHIQDFKLNAVRWGNWGIQGIPKL